MKNYDVLRCFQFRNLDNVLNVTIQFMQHDDKKKMYDEEKRYIASRSAEGWTVKYVGSSESETCKFDEMAYERLNNEINKAIEEKNKGKDMYLRINIMDLEAQNLAFEFLRN